MQTTYLIHHGIKGQKWGIRRFQNEDGSLTPEGEKKYGTVKNFKKKINYKTYYDERNIIEKDYYKKHSHQKEIDKLNNESMELAKKYKFDLDDGGGGKTEEDKKAGDKYWELQTKIDDLMFDDELKAKEYVDKYMIKKYGSKKVKSLEETENFVSGMKAVGLLLTLPISLPIGIAIGIREASKETDK